MSEDVQLGLLQRRERSAEGDGGDRWEISRRGLYLPPTCLFIKIGPRSITSWTSFPMAWLPTLAANKVGKS